MKISYRWLKRYLPIDLNPELVSELLTDTGLEVEGLEEVETIPGGLRGVVVGEVLTCIQHPNADRLRITTVEIGAEEARTNCLRRTQCCCRSKGPCSDRRHAIISRR